MLDFSFIGGAAAPGDPLPDPGKALAKPDPYGLSPVRDWLGALDAGIKSLQAQMIALVVDSDAAKVQAVEMVGTAKQIRKEIEARRHEIIEAPDKFVRTVNGMTKPLKDRLDSIVSHGETRVANYGFMEEMRRREREKAAQAEIAKKQKELDARAATAGVAPVQLPKMVLPQNAGPLRTETATATVGTEWAFEVESLARVPDRYVRRLIDEEAVNRAIADGIRSIEGIRIFERPKVTIRANR